MEPEMKHGLTDVRWLAGLLACVASAVWAQQAESTPSTQPPQQGATAPVTAMAVAGLAPFERPEGAPVVTEFKRSPEWRAKAVQGVSAPVPQSLDFLDSQGGWYSPFLEPGMPGRYDIRGWHAKATR